ncbi:MAG: hypothetical protein ACJAVK_002235 [Akkermansiaceae bacterium]|jgi:hypothetical protein
MPRRGDEYCFSCLDGGIYKVSTLSKLLSKPDKEISRHDNFAAAINWPAPLTLRKA